MLAAKKTPKEREKEKGNAFEKSIILCHVVIDDRDDDNDFESNSFGKRLL